MNRKAVQQNQKEKCHRLSSTVMRLLWWLDALTDPPHGSPSL
tara:strand:- start:10 stop:135 length:126 start_codon:yes stop_codon:yes gene_type:complete